MDPNLRRPRVAATSHLGLGLGYRERGPWVGSEFTSFLDDRRAGDGVEPAVVDGSDTLTYAADTSPVDRRPDSECQERASDFLTQLIGSPTDPIWWDTHHHLCGHVCLHGLNLVVIAPRDTAHQPVVLTAPDWEAVRMASADERSVLLARWAIADHNRLEDVLAESGCRRG